MVKLPWFLILKVTGDTMKRHSIEHWKIISIFLVIFDAAAVFVSYGGALLVRFDFRYRDIPQRYLQPHLHSLLVLIAATILLFWVFRLYRSVWRFASYDELKRILLANLCVTGVNILIMNVFFGRMPIFYYMFGAVALLFLTAGVRFAYRFILLLRNKEKNRSEQDDIPRKNVMIIGAGQAGNAIMRDIKITKETSDRVRCFIDDNPNKWGRFIENIPIVGGREKILESVEQYHIEKIYLAIPSATAEQRRDILAICKESDCELMNLPGYYQLYTGEVTVSKMKKVQIEDLLGREPIKVNTDVILEQLEGMTVLVTGGGGSIGSELVRQIAAHAPKCLIIFDIYENNAYDIQLEIRKKYPDLNLVTLIGSVRDSRKMFRLFEEYRPQVVFHAAAHKHVPLMEDSPCEAIKNNVFGTYKTAFAAVAHGCRRFVLISTDKAVNPTNIMGASKRLCEMVIQAFDKKVREGKAAELPQFFTHSMSDEVISPEIREQLANAKTEFVAVRFGNVLGSNGSVIPLFRKQIEEGGPVTVTHPDIIRYFMTIPEAVSLVLQAGAYAHGGEIFVLDMGSPVKIDSLARNLIRLSGYKPDKDIRIVYTGLRPGEKLYEEKLMAEEG